VRGLRQSTSFRLRLRLIPNPMVVSYVQVGPSHCPRPRRSKCIPALEPMYVNFLVRFQTERPRAPPLSERSKAIIRRACGIAALRNHELRKNIAEGAYMHLCMARPNLLPWKWQDGILSTNKLENGTVLGGCAFIRPQPFRQFQTHFPRASHGNVTIATKNTRF
jgi:hypothetical protein